MCITDQFLMENLLSAPNFVRKKPVGFGNEKIYAYTDEDRYEGRIERDLKPRLKIGGTRKELAKDRIDEQDGSSQPVDLVQKKVYDTPFWDIPFHKWLEKRGYVRVRKNREWFEITVEELDKEIEAYSEELGKSSYEIKSTYTPRTYQTIVASEVVSRWNGRTITQPIKACPRFGKDYLHLDIFKRSGFRVMLIIGWVLSANEGLVELVKECSQITNDITVITNYDEYIEALATDNRILIDVSLHGDDVKIDPRLLDELEKEDALIVVDEADFGAWKRKETLQKYTDRGNNLLLLSTGTNIERAMINAGDTQEIIDVSYLDLLELHKAGDATYSDLVKTSSLSIEITDEIRREFSKQSAEDTPTMTKVFSSRNSHLFPLTIKQLFSDEENGTDLFKLYAQKHDELDHPTIMLFTSTTQKDVDLYCKKGRKIAPHLQWISLHSKNIIIVDGVKVKLSNRNAQRTIQKLINDSDKEGTVIVSCSMGARSFSIPNIMVTINAQDKGDIEAIIQRFSRGLTPGCDKKYGIIVDYCFDSNRISSFDKYLLSSELDKGSTYSNAIRRVYGLHQFLKKDEYGYLVKLTEDESASKLSSDINVSSVLCTKIDVQYINENREYLKSILTATKDSWNNFAHLENGIESPIKGAKNYIETLKAIKVSKNKEDLVPEKVCRDVVKNAANVFYLAPNSTTFEDGLNTISLDSDKDQEYIKLVGTSASVITKVLLHQCLPVDLLDTVFNRVSSSTDHNDKHFRSQTSSHVAGLFDFSKIIGNDVLYAAKEPDAAVMEELQYLSKNKNLTVICCQLGYLEFYKLMGYNVITLEDFLNMSTKKFYILTNYPFSDRSSDSSNSKDIDKLFVLKGQDIGYGGQEIIRTKHFTNKSSAFRKKLFSSGNIESIERLDDNVFPTIQNTETCIVSWNSNHTGDAKIQYKDGTIVEKNLNKDTVIKFNNPNFVHEVDNNLSHRWLRGKVSRSSLIEGDSPIVEICGKGETPVIKNIQKGLEDTARNCYGVVMNINAAWGGLGKVMIKPYEASISNNVVCLRTDTEEDAITLQQYLLSDEIAKEVDLNMAAYHPSKDLFLKITDPLV